MSRALLVAAVLGGLLMCCYDIMTPGFQPTLSLGGGFVFGVSFSILLDQRGQP